MFLDEPLSHFLDQLASNAPTPGGGSVAAVTGALAAGLVSMVCNLTIGKEKYKDVEADVQSILSRSEALRQRLAGLMQSDVEAYGKLAAAYKMPRSTDAEKQARTSAVQEACVTAANVPLAIAENCVEIINLCPEAAAKGNVGAVTDVGVAVLLAEAALRSAILNVEINLNVIKDQAYVESTRARIQELLAGKADLKERVMQDVESKL